MAYSCGEVGLTCLMRRHASLILLYAALIQCYFVGKNYVAIIFMYNFISTLVCYSKSCCDWIIFMLLTGRSGVRFPAGARDFFSSPYPSGLTLGPPSLLFIQWVSGLKRPGREVDNSPQFSTEVENEWIYPSAPPICLYGADRDNYTFAFYALWEEKFFYCL